MAAQEISLNHEALDEFRTCLDATIKKLISVMIDKNMMTGEVTGKIKITAEVSDSTNSLPAYKLSIEPDVKMKIGAKGQMKCKKQEGLFLKFGLEGEAIVGEKQLDIDGLLVHEGLKKYA